MDMLIGSWKGTGRAKFSPREMEAVLLCANNLTVKQAAKQMRITPDSVTKRLSSAKFKVGVSSIRALVLESLRLGFISDASYSVPTDPGQKPKERQHDGVLLA